MLYYIHRAIFLLALDVIYLDSRYIEFFNDLPSHAKLTIQALIPEKYSVLNTQVLACVLYNHAVLRKIVTDNMKETAQKIVNQTLKRTKDTEKLTMFEDMLLSSECIQFIENYLYFKHKFSNSNSELMTTYLSYELMTDKELYSYKFFEDCVYAKEKSKLAETLYVSLKQSTGIDRSEMLETFGEYLTNPFRVKRYVCFGRDSEIEKCVSILCRYKKSNAILVGNPGVGKTSVIYGICNYLQSDKCPECLKKYDVFSLNITKLISGTTYRGDLEERLSELIDELKQYPNIILFIDEVHALFTKTSGESDQNVVQNALKPFLADGSHVIGCTTNSGYKIIESDPAFERRFTVVPIKEPDIESCKKIILNVKHQYESFHGIQIPDDVARSSIDLCNQYVKNRYFPDKAFDCIDSACSKCRQEDRSELTYNDVESSALRLAGITENRFNLQDIDYQANEIKTRILCQDHAIDAVCKCLKRYCVGVNNKMKPIGSFLFVGPTGTGKTELCKQIAARFFNSESFIRFDMSEFMESHSVSKLIGSPPGYVGFDRKGALTEKIKHNPFSIILFDEIEKANIDVINILLQMMDDGRLTDAYGTTVNFCNTIIVMTSNIGCKEYLDKNSIGFGQTDNSDILKKSVNNYFSPEFRNRLDAIIYFNPINRDMFDSIFRNEINSFIDRYKQCGIDVELSEDRYRELKDKCFDEKNGVRFVQRKISQLIEDQILDEVVRGNKHIKL